MSPRATVALPTADRRRAHAFYGAGLGFDTPGTPADDGVPEPLTVVVTEGCQLMMIPTGGFGWVTAGRTVAEPGTVECLLSLDRDTPAELDAFVERARAAGAEIVAEPEDRPGGYSATFTDPDAHMWQVLVPARE
jgi:predicted lactoylglutathione lyase